MAKQTENKANLNEHARGAWGTAAWAGRGASPAWPERGCRDWAQYEPANGKPTAQDHLFNEHVSDGQKSLYTTRVHHSTGLVKHDLGKRSCNAWEPLEQQRQKAEDQEDEELTSLAGKGCGYLTERADEHGLRV